MGNPSLVLGVEGKSQRSPLLWLLLPFMCGLVLGRLGWVYPNVLTWAIAGVVSAFLAWRCRQRAVVWGCCLVAASVFSGGAWYRLSRARLEAWDRLPARELHLELEVTRLFTQKPGARGPSGVGIVKQSDDPTRELVGQRVYFGLRGPAQGELEEGARLSCVGVVRVLAYSAAPTTFEGYLSSAGVNLTLERGRHAEVVARASWYRRFCHRAQDRLGGILSLGLGKHLELSAVYRAMVLGQISDMSKEQNRLFQLSGTMHLFSVSGLHIGVVALVWHFLLTLARAGPRVRLVLLASMLWLYIDVTGPSPAAVRSFWMAVLVETAFAFRLPVNGMATLVFAAWVALWCDPMTLFSASFELSFGMMVALLVWAGPLGEHAVEKTLPFQRLPGVLWTRWHHAWAKGLRAVLPAVALALGTAPVSEVCTVLYFNVVTPVALVANLIMIPLSSLVIISGFLSLLTGLCGLSSVASHFNFAAALLLKLMDLGLGWVMEGSWTHHHATFRSVELGFVCLGALLASILAGGALGWAPRKWGLALPAVVAGVIFVLAVRYD